MKANRENPATNRDKKLSPAELAAQTVQERMDAILTSTAGMLEYDGDFHSDIEEIAGGIAREKGKNEDDEDEDTKFHWAEAGYLVGVQVGLRLRIAGGAR